jgi:hypothetical protein
VTNLSAEAQDILLEASLDESGIIIQHKDIMGPYISTNGKRFGEQSNARAMALYMAALQELANADLLERVTGMEGNVYRVTHDGYLESDQIKG